MAETTSQNSALATLNDLPPERAQQTLLECCSVRAWAAAVAGGRPYETLEDLLHVSDTALETLTGDDVAEALAGHPRIGERAEGDGRDTAWSRHEQSGAADSTDVVRQALAAGNAAYEQRFDQVFLICATGLTGEQMLAELQARLTNDDDTERAVVREELHKITRLRLAKLVQA